jgi:hypothetical protein
MNLQQFRAEVVWLLNMSVGEPDQDFDGTAADPYKVVDSLINQARKLEYNMALPEVGADPFMVYQEYTWNSGDVAFDIPPGIDTSDISNFYDVTDGARGSVLVIGERMDASAVYWSGRRQLSWGTEGPGSDRILRIEYLAVPQDLTETGQEDDTFPPQFHNLIPWTAAILGKAGAQDKIPESWTQIRDEHRADLWKHLSNSRPRRRGPALRSAMSATYGLTLTSE